MKMCVSCKTVLRDDCRFCSQCGQNQFADMPVTSKLPESADVKEVPAGRSEAQTEEKMKTSEMRKKASWGSRILTGFLCVFITLFMILGGLFLLVRFSFSENAINFASKALDDKVSDIQVGFLIEDEDEDLTLSEFVYGNLGRKYRQYISEDGVEDLLNEDFIREFVAERLHDSISFVLYDDGDGEVTSKDIDELLEDNRRAFEKAAGCSLADLGIDVIASDMEKEGMLEILDFTSYERKLRDEFSLIRLMFSGIVEGVLLIVILILVTCIFLLRKDKENAFSSVGAAFVVTGGFYVLIVAATYILAFIANKAAAFGMDLYNAFLNPLRLSGVIIAGGFLLIGLVLIMISKLLRKKNNI